MMLVALSLTLPGFFAPTTAWEGEGSNWTSDPTISGTNGGTKKWNGAEGALSFPLWKMFEPYLLSCEAAGGQNTPI